MTDMKKLTYEEFVKEFIGRMEEEPGTEISFYKKGYTGDDEESREFVLVTNERHFQQRKASLLNDFFKVTSMRRGDLKDEMRLNAETLYEGYKSGGWEFITNGMRAARSEVKKLEEVARMDSGEEKWPKERMIIRPISYTDNKYQLKDVPYWKIGDIALVLYMIIDQDDNGLSTMKMKKSSLEKAGMDEESTMIEALLNTTLLYPPRIYESGNYNPAFEEGQFMTTSCSEKLKSFMIYRLSTTNVVNGAVALFYPGVQKKLAELMGGDYYVCFTSIHEAMIHSAKTFSISGIRESVRAINQQFGKEDYLTNKVFRYNSETGKLEY